MRQVGVSLSAGVLVGLIDVGVLISLGALIFAGPLAAFLANAIGLTLVGGAVMAAAVALLSTRPATIATVQDTPAIIVAVMAAGIAAGAAGDDPRALYATVVATIVVTSLVTGATFLLLGQFRLGALARYFPYPVRGIWHASHECGLVCERRSDRLAGCRLPSGANRRILSATPANNAAGDFA
jgi:SulP family sulfate permease